MKQLNFMQKQFVTEYIKTLDGEKSVKNAGFTVEDAKEFAQEFAQELLSRDYIIREIKYQLNRQIDALNVPKGYVIQKLLQIAQFSLEEEDILDKDGNFTGKRKLRDSSAGLKALESLCKYLGFSSSVGESYREAKIITISNLDDKKI